MILNLTELRNEFENLKKIRIDIKQYFEKLSDKIQLLTSIYGKYIKDQENTGTILFGLDALHFQTFLIHFEYDNMKNMHILIENKLYCEYYKLFKLIINYVKVNINEEAILKVCEHKSKYPVYKDLEQYKIYDFDLINEIHDDILLLLELMSKFVIKKEKELEEDETNTTNGLNLHIVVNTIDFNITLLKQNLKLYTNYLKIFHKYHTTYLSRLNIKIGIMWGQVNKDIKIEQKTGHNSSIICINDERKSEKISRTPSLTNIEQKELISFINTNDVSLSVKDELNEIMIHISDESSTDNEHIIYDNEINDNIDSIESNHNNDTNVNNNDNKIDINIVNLNHKEESNLKMNSNDSNDVGALSTNELKERWMMVLNEIQITTEDNISQNHLIKDNEEVKNEIQLNNDNTDNTDNNDNTYDMSNIQNEKDELEK